MDTRKSFLLFMLGLLLVAALAACAPWNALVEHAIVQTQTAQAEYGQGLTPPPAEEATPNPWEEATEYPYEEVVTPEPWEEATEYPYDEEITPEPWEEATEYPYDEEITPAPWEEATEYPYDEEITPAPWEEATEIPLEETVSPIPGEGEDLLGELTVEPPALESTPDLSAFPSAAVSTRAANRKDLGSGFIVVAVLVLVGVFVQLESKTGKNNDKD